MHPSILRNTLISERGIDSILSLPRENDIYAPLSDILYKFQDKRQFASEIHTETDLVKPILKIFGYAYESKPSFFVDRIKGPDVALFSTEENRIAASPLWGTQRYYDNTLGILLLKRYGRTLDKGISGFYLEFENKIPVYQVLYLLKQSKSPWGMLTNGRRWIVIKRPVNFETKLIEIDIEALSSEDKEETLHLFYHIFSLTGLTTTLPGILKEERTRLIALLKEQKSFAQRSIQGLKKKTEIYPEIARIYKNFLPEGTFSLTETFAAEKNIEIKACKDQVNEKPSPINNYDISDIFSYLFLKNESQAGLDLEEIITDGLKQYTKEDILSLKMLDMTPGFGASTIRILEGLAYLSFLLPYKERNTFVAEWEDEHMLKAYILNHIFYGIERSRICLDIFHNTIKERFHANAPFYKHGNPLLGMSMNDIPSLSDSKKQLNLFTKNPGEVIKDFKETYRLYATLSDRIKEDAEIKQEIEIKLNTGREKIKDILDAITAKYFIKSIDGKKIQDMLCDLGSEKSEWEVLGQKNWFIESKEIAKRYGFFHFEIEFPFLLNSAFDFIFVRPSLRYIWEEKPPLIEATKAYIKSGMRYLKPGGKFIIYTDDTEEALSSELDKSKKYDIKVKSGFILLSRKADDHI